MFDLLAAALPPGPATAPPVPTRLISFPPWVVICAPPAYRAPLAPPPVFPPAPTPL
jgi:hypothetical protein